MASHRVVYIVDDDRGLLQTLELILSNAGMLTSSYKSSQDFLQHADTFPLAACFSTIGCRLRPAGMCCVR